MFDQMYRVDVCQKFFKSSMHRSMSHEPPHVCHRTKPLDQPPEQPPRSYTHSGVVDQAGL